MLRYIYIKNFALIKTLEIEFKAGLTILSGETGTGKSIIIGSMNAIAGGKLETSIIRKGETYILVEMIFTMDQSILKDFEKKYGIEIETEDELLLSRKFNETGRSIYRVNNQVVTRKVMEAITSKAIDIHSQHVHQSLLRPANHIHLLDQYIGEEVALIKEKMRSLYKSYKIHKQELSQNPLEIEQRLREIDFLEFEINEIKQANLEIGEDEQVQKDYKRLANQEKILAGLERIETPLTTHTDGNIEVHLDYMAKELNRIQYLDEPIGELVLEVEQVESLVQGLKRSIEDYKATLTLDSQGLGMLEERIHLINTLKAKYGQTIEIVLKALEEKTQQLERLMHYETNREALRKQVEEEEEEILKECAKLNKLRKIGAKEIGMKIEKVLRTLNFPDSQVRVQVDQQEIFNQNGYDQVAILISTNKNEPILPLIEIASGGELSRVMLAIKSVFAELDQIGTLVFDEIDSGISGRTAQRVGEKMALLSKRRQLICITHLPQISAMADNHYLIEKRTEGNRVETSMRLLEKEGVVEELARLIGGASITENTLASAQEMKEQAEDWKREGI